MPPHRTKREDDEVEDDGDRRRNGWSERQPTWGHMAIALACMAGSSVAWTWNSTREYAAAAAATERRLTQLEERYLNLSERSNERNNLQDQKVGEMLLARNAQILSIEKKLESIASDVTGTKVDIATIKQQLTRARF